MPGVSSQCFPELATVWVKATIPPRRFSLVERSMLLWVLQLRELLRHLVRLLLVPLVFVLPPHRAQTHPKFLIGAVLKLLRLARFERHGQL